MIINRLLLLLLVITSCGDPTGGIPTREIEPRVPPVQHQDTIQRDATTKKDTLKQLEKEEPPNYYPTFEFSLRDRQGDTVGDKYRITESIITFFITDTEKEQLAEMENAGYPAPWWEGRNCGYYEYDENKLITFLRVAKEMRHLNYGFRCEAISANARDGALTNGIVVMFHGINPVTKDLVKNEEMVAVLKKYGIYASVQSTRPRYYYTLFEGLSAREIVKRSNQLNEEEIVKYARNSFSNCNGRPHIN